MNHTPHGIALVESPFLSITALVVDAALQSANVRLLGVEPIGTEVILSRFSGDPGGLRAAVDAADARARALGTRLASTSIIDRPAEGLELVAASPPGINPLYQGREIFLPQPANTPTMNPSPAIGILETQGLTAILHATDAMLKAADVELVGKEKIGAAYVTVIVRGDVAAVRAAVDAGARAVGDRGKLIASEVIPRPHEGLLRLLPS